MQVELYLWSLIFYATDHAVIWLLNFDFDPRSYFMQVLKSILARIGWIGFDSIRIHTSRQLVQDIHQFLITFHIFFQRGYLSIVAAYSPCSQDACSIPTFCDKQTGWVLSLPLCTRQSTTGRTWKNNLKNLYLIAIKLNCAPVSLFFLGQDLSNFTQAKEMPPSIAYEEPHFAQPELWSNCAVVV